MPFLFIIVGVLFVVSAVRGTNTQLIGLLKGDFTGHGNFVYWLASILVIGAVGYIPELKPVSRAFLVLVIVVLFLSNKGVFAKATQALGTTQQAQPLLNIPTNPTSGASQILQPLVF